MADQRGTIPERPNRPEHAIHAGALPPIHAGPFDRLIVAEALAEPFRLVTREAAVARCSDTIVPV